MDRTSERADDASGSQGDPSEIPQGASDARSSKDSRPPGLAAGPVSLLLAGLAGGALAVILVQVFDGWFQIPPEMTAGIGSSPPPEKLAEIAAASHVADYKNLTILIGLFGLAVGGALGAAEGIARKSGRAVAILVVTGALFGGIFGAAAGPLGKFIGQSLPTTVDDAYRAALMHIAVWAVSGIGIGLGVALPSRRPNVIGRSVGAAIGGGFLAGLAYEIAASLAAIAFPLALPDSDPAQLLPDGLWARMLWIGLAAGLMGLAIGSIGGQPSDRKRIA